LGARRQARIDALAQEIGGTARALPLDVTDQPSVDRFCDELGEGCRLLVNCAGGAFGAEPVARADDDHWGAMWDTNVMGLVRMTRALLPRLLASGDGHIVNMGSVAGFEPYASGGGYNAAKHGARAVTDVLRIELVGQPIRVSEIDPGLVRTEFSLVRFDGDQARADAVYEGLEPSPPRRQRGSSGRRGARLRCLGDLDGRLQRRRRQVVRVTSVVRVHPVRPLLQLLGLERARALAQGERRRPQQGPAPAPTSRDAASLGVSDSVRECRRP